jgi:pimeloyl-ACP methyl ester carboxylesterase
LAAYQDLANSVGFSANGGPEDAPDVEGAQLDPQAAVNANRIVEAGSNFGVFDTIKEGILGGLRQVSFWMMKNRGRKVGEQGMYDFLTNLMNAVPARTHVMGHSFGCVVASSLLGGPDCKGKLPRAVNSAVLVQGAVSLWSWGDKVKDTNKPGYYRNIVSTKAVSGPVVSTRSVNDSAVGLAYPAAVALVGQAAFDTTASLPLFGGVGSFGIQGTAIAQSSPMLDAAGTYGFQPGKIYNLEGSAFIPSHSGIDGPQVAHAIWQAAL